MGRWRQSGRAASGGGAQRRRSGGGAGAPGGPAPLAVPWEAVRRDAHSRRGQRLLQPRRALGSAPAGSGFKNGASWEARQSAIRRRPRPARLPPAQPAGSCLCIPRRPTLGGAAGSLSFSTMALSLSRCPLVYYKEAVFDVACGTASATGSLQESLSAPGDRATPSFGASSDAKQSSRAALECRALTRLGLLNSYFQTPVNSLRAAAGASRDFPGPEGFLAMRGCAAAAPSLLCSRVASCRPTTDLYTLHERGATSIAGNRQLASLARCSSSDPRGRVQETKGRKPGVQEGTPSS